MPGLARWEFLRSLPPIVSVATSRPSPALSLSSRFEFRSGTAFGRPSRRLALLWPDYFFYDTPRNKQRDHLRAARYAQPFQRRSNYDAVISGAFKFPRLLPRTLIGDEAHVGMWACASVSRAVLSPHKTGKTATPNLREIAQNPRRNAESDRPFYPPLSVFRSYARCS